MPKIKVIFLVIALLAVTLCPISGDQDQDRFKNIVEQISESQIIKDIEIKNLKIPISFGEVKKKNSLTYRKILKYNLIIQSY